ncbi:Os05g0459200 [Oryza sativa Japonica Group]|uniref:Os05g0459200 protein n=1 Tax=Oryza sativa subsp. japonica TaxID=39947 RepID=A0A0P0WN77_ORYSJ|nr:hypothetical protein EE612_029969 [Oryza sativa]KAF2931124.1 hypothetical protein DAI22_05g186550 [Oryza sativa Japonica Group]BAS94391.1 Os05g0459200 [Oryza sativa Japonica Group]
MGPHKLGQTSRPEKDAPIPPYVRRRLPPCHGGATAPATAMCMCPCGTASAPPVSPCSRPLTWRPPCPRRRVASGGLAVSAVTWSPGDHWSASWPPFLLFCARGSARLGSAPRRPPRFNLARWQ